MPDLDLRRILGKSFWSRSDLHLLTFWQIHSIWQPKFGLNGWAVTFSFTLSQNLQSLLPAGPATLLNRSKRSNSFSFLLSNSLVPLRGHPFFRTVFQNSLFVGGGVGSDQVAVRLKDPRKIYTPWKSGFQGSTLIWIILFVSGPCFDCLCRARNYEKISAYP